MLKNTTLSQETIRERIRSGKGQDGFLKSVVLAKRGDFALVRRPFGSPAAEFAILKFFVYPTVFQAIRTFEKHADAAVEFRLLVEHAYGKTPRGQNRSDPAPS